MPKGYERLLHDVMTGNQTLFQRAAFVEEGWRLIQPVLDAWAKAPEEPFPNYAAGSMGPPEAKALIAKAAASWYLLSDT